jgi:uncharacterized membrane protein YgaE (UPF0421/DUF939 family)
MFESEKKALEKCFKLPRPTLRESLLLAAIYAAQAVLCTTVLTLAYAWAKAPDVGWAIISSILVLQPGITEALAASIARILANIVGATVALIVVWFLGVGLWQILLAIVVIVFLCELLRLDMGLRAACVSAIIIMTFRDSSVFMAGVARSISVIIGSALAVVVQIAGWRLKLLLFPHAVHGVSHSSH